MPPRSPCISKRSCTSVTVPQNPPWPRGETDRHTPGEPSLATSRRRGDATTRAAPRTPLDRLLACTGALLASNWVSLCVPARGPEIAFAGLTRGESSFDSRRRPSRSFSRGDAAATERNSLSRVFLWTAESSDLSEKQLLRSSREKGYRTFADFVGFLRSMGFHEFPVPRRASIGRSCE